jgi:hypothetical protein
MTTGAMATVMAAKTITTATAAGVVEVTTKMAEGTDNNQLKW